MKHSRSEHCQKPTGGVSGKEVQGFQDICRSSITLSCGRHRPSVGRQCVFASLECAPLAGQRETGTAAVVSRSPASCCWASLLWLAPWRRPLSCCSSLASCRVRAPPCSCQIVSRSWVRVLRRGERPRNRHMGGDRSRGGRDRACPWRVAHRCRQLAPRLSDQRSVSCGRDRTGVPLRRQGRRPCSRQSRLIRWSAGHSWIGPGDLALTEGSGRGWSPSAFVVLGAGLIFSLLFLSAERRLGDNAMMPLSLFGSPSFVGLGSF